MRICCYCFGQGNSNTLAQPLDGVNTRAKHDGNHHIGYRPSYPPRILRNCCFSPVVVLSLTTLLYCLLRCQVCDEGKISNRQTARSTCRYACTRVNRCIIRVSLCWQRWSHVRWSSCVLSPTIHCHFCLTHSPADCPCRCESIHPGWVPNRIDWQP